MNITISRDHIQALLLTAAKKDVRYYLEGVHIMPELAQSSDGHVAGRVRSPFIESDGEYILPRVSLELWLKAAPKTRDLLQIADGMADGIQFQPINGQFPNVQPLFNSADTHNNAPGQYDPELLLRFKKVSKLYGIKNGAFSLHQNGADVAAVTIPGVDAYRGLIMPWRV